MEEYGSSAARIANLDSIYERNRHESVRGKIARKASLTSPERSRAREGRGGQERNA
jgi:hypothetical protein